MQYFYVEQVQHASDSLELAAYHCSLILLAN